MIIFRYLAKEVFAAFIMISLILLLIFLSNQFSHYLKLTAAGKIVGLQLLHLMLLEMPQLASLIFPLGLYLSILLVYGRLYADNEMTILKTCGLSQTALFKMTIGISACVSGAVMLFTLWLNPMIAQHRNQLLAQIGSQSILQTLLPGRFQQANNGRQIFYIESMSNDKQSLKNIFAAERTDTDNWTVMSAQNGHHFIEPLTKDHFVVAQNGYRYEGSPGEKNFTLLHFGQYGLRLNMPMSYLSNKDIDSLSLRQLFKNKHHKLEYTAELQWRLSLPICVFILGFIALGLSQVKPREGRFAKFFPAILIYIIYANFMLISQNWMSAGQLSPYIGVWILHSVMIILGIILYRPLYQPAIKLLPVFKQIFKKQNRVVK